MTKDVVKHYRMTTEDAKAFHEKAERAGMTEAEYFRLLITQKPSDYPEIRSGLKDLVNEVNRIGVNVNEIVYSHNAALYSVADKERLYAYMQKLNHTVKKAVKEIGNHEDIND